MSHYEQVQCFQDELESLIMRYCAEFDLSYAALIGVMECVKLDVWRSGANLA